MMSLPGTGCCGDLLAAGDRAALGRHLLGQLARRAAQDVGVALLGAALAAAVLQLEAGDADPVDVGAADHAAAGLAAGQQRACPRGRR